MNARGLLSSSSEAQQGFGLLEENGKYTNENGDKDSTLSRPAFESDPPNVNNGNALVPFATVWKYRNQAYIAMRPIPTGRSNTIVRDELVELSHHFQQHPNASSILDFSVEENENEEVVEAAAMEKVDVRD